MPVEFGTKYKIVFLFKYEQKYRDIDLGIFVSICKKMVIQSSVVSTSMLYKLPPLGSVT